MASVLKCVEWTCVRSDFARYYDEAMLSSLALLLDQSIHPSVPYILDQCAARDDELRWHLYSSVFRKH